MHVWSLQLAQSAFSCHPGAPVEAGTPHRRPGLPAAITHQSNATQTCPLANQMGVLFSAEVLPSQMTLAGIELRKQANTSANDQIWCASDLLQEHSQAWLQSTACWAFSLRI